MFPFGPSAKSLAMFYRQFATLYGSGVPISRSLDVLDRQVKAGAIRRAVAGIKSDVAGGDTLADAFAKQPRAFPKMHVAVIAAGEHSGNLEQSLVGLAELVERRMAMRRRIISALIYPFLLFNAIALIPAGARAFFPATQNVFPIDPLPLLVEFYVVLIGVFLAAKLVGAMGVLKSLGEGVLLLVPFIGGIWRKVTLARFSRLFATLYRSGLSVTKCIESAGEASGSIALDRAAARASERVHAGDALQEAFGRSRLFNAMFVNMVATGEESGNLDEMLDKVAEYHEGQAELAIEALVKIVPLAIYLAVAACAAVTIIGAFKKLYSEAGLM